MNPQKLYKLLLMCILAIFSGVLAAIGAIVFKIIVAFIHNLLFSGHISFIYNPTIHTAPSVWGIGVIFVPVIGGVIVIWLIEHFAQDERGLSVPEVMYKIRYQEGKISPVTALAKTLASAVSIGTGASIGREGPIIQIGAAISSLLSDIANLSVDQRKILLAAGAAAGAAAIFNAPLAGIAFAIELLLLSINIPAVLLIVVATITTTCITTFIFGNEPIFSIKSDYHFNGYLWIAINALLFTFLGIVVGICSTVFIRAVYWLEDTFNSLFKNSYIRHMTGMFVIGVLLYMMMNIFGHYYIEGIGYATIKDCLVGILINPWFLFLLFVCKLFATCLSLGSGASGGIFSPTLFMGATLGASLGLIFNHFFPHMVIDPIIFTTVGMGAAVGSTTGAVIMAIALAFELTGNLQAVLPMMISVPIAYFTRRAFCHQSIYTLKLYRRGITEYK